jgi:hypothetical protein
MPDHAVHEPPHDLELFVRLKGHDGMEVSYGPNYAGSSVLSSGTSGLPTVSCVTKDRIKYASVFHVLL